MRNFSEEMLCYFDSIDELDRRGVSLSDLVVFMTVIILYKASMNSTGSEKVYQKIVYPLLRSEPDLLLVSVILYYLLAQDEPWYEPELFHNYFDREIKSLNAGGFKKLTSGSTIFVALFLAYYLDDVGYDPYAYGMKRHVGKLYENAMQKKDLSKYRENYLKKDPGDITGNVLFELLYNRLYGIDKPFPDLVRELYARAGDPAGPQAS